MCEVRIVPEVPPHTDEHLTCTEFTVCRYMLTCSLQYTEQLVQGRLSTPPMYTCTYNRSNHATLVYILLQFLHFLCALTCQPFTVWELKGGTCCDVCLYYLKLVHHREKCDYHRPSITVRYNVCACMYMHALECSAHECILQ